MTHFLVAGLIIFIGASALKPPAPSTVIVVDREALLSFVQYRAKAFEPAAAAAILDSMDAERKRLLIEDFVREEALDREAKLLGLDAADYVIRQRRVQKAEFLAEALVKEREPTNEEIARHFAENKEKYATPPTATLTHVFISLHGRTPSAAAQEAAALIRQLNSARVEFKDSLKFGERFLFQKNYVGRTEDFIRSQLGDAAADAVFDAQAPLKLWYGPFPSDYGAHGLYVAERSAKTYPTLEEVSEAVKQNVREEQRRRDIEKAVDAIVARYKIKYALDRDA